MDGTSVNTIVVVGVPLVGAVVWLIRLEGRVNTHEQKCDERQKRLDERHENIERQLLSIDRKLDRMLGPE